MNDERIKKEPTVEQAAEWWNGIDGSAIHDADKFSLAAFPFLNSNELDGENGEDGAKCALFGYYDGHVAGYTASEARYAKLVEALVASQSAMIGLVQELGLIDAQTPGGLPYGIKNPKIACDLQLMANARCLAALKEDV